MAVEKYLWRIKTKMGLLDKLLGIPENSSISEEFNNVFSPKVADDYREEYEAADRNLEEENKRRSQPSSMYHNCPNPNCQYQPDITCLKCNGTGHVDD
jgi:hypothetical protein